MKSLVAFISAVVVSLSAVTFTYAETPSPVGKSQVEQQVPKTDKVNLNSADVDALMTLKGIGAKKAEAIVAWRKEHGQFKSVEQLMDVKGIGESIFAQNKQRLSI